MELSISNGANKITLVGIDLGGLPFYSGGTNVTRDLKVDTKFLVKENSRKIHPTADSSTRKITARQIIDVFMKIRIVLIVK